MKVKVKRMSEQAEIPQKAHESANGSDFCYDVVAVSEEEVAPNVWRYGIGLAFELPDKEALLARYNQLPFDIILSIDFRCRSSIYKTGMILSNCEGTIDEIYRGEVKAVFYHVFPNLPRYKVGDHIGQIKIGFTVPMEFEEVERLSETARGANGYGSSYK